MLRDLTENEFQALMAKKARIGESDAQAQLDRLTGKKKIRLISRIGTGSNDTMVFSAIHIPSKEKEGVAKKLRAIKEVRKKRLEDKYESISKTAQGPIIKTKTEHIHSAAARPISTVNYFEIIENLPDHPYIIKYYPESSYFSDDGRVFINMELLNFDGDDLYRNSLDMIYNILRTNSDKDLVARVWDEVPMIFGRICSALESTHNVRIIHRDLKPENIMFDLMTGEDIDLIECLNENWELHTVLTNKLKEGKPIYPKIIDFGAAKDEGKISANSMTIVGTSYFTPPEYRAYQDFPETADIYQIGVMLYELYVDKGARGGKETKQETGYPIFSKLLEDLTKKLIDKENIQIDFSEFDIIWSNIRREHQTTKTDSKREEKNQKYAMVRQKVIDQIAAGIKDKLPENPLMANVIRKAIAARPEDRYRSMCDLKLDILLASYSERLLEIEDKAKVVMKARNKESFIDLLNDLGEVIEDIEAKEKNIRTDYRTGNEIAKISGKSIVEYFLEDNDWEETKSIRTGYRLLRLVFNRTMPDIPDISRQITNEDGNTNWKIDDNQKSMLLAEAGKCKKILDFEDRYAGVDTLVKYMMDEKDVGNISGPLRTMLNKIYSSRHTQVRRYIHRFMEMTDDQPDRKDSTPDDTARIGDQLEELHLEPDEYKEILSAYQTALVIFEPRYARDIGSEDNNNVFFSAER